MGIPVKDPWSDMVAPGRRRHKHLMMTHGEKHPDRGACTGKWRQEGQVTSAGVWRVINRGGRECS